MEKQGVISLPLEYPGEARELLLVVHQAILAAELREDTALALSLTGIYTRLQRLVRSQM